jgi:putative DNA-invertase from lambdoid prophage Rac
MFNVIGAMAQFERDLIPERTRAGLQKLKLAGVKLGRPMAKLNVSAIQELRASGASWSEIARQTGLARGTLQKACANCDWNLQSAQK